MMRRLTVVLSLLLTLALAGIARAQESSGTPAAKAEFDRGMEAQRKGDYTAAAAAYQKAIELDPNFAEAHQNFIFMSKQAATASLRGRETDPAARPLFKEAGEKETRRLEALYEEWARQNPKSAAYQWALGDLNMYRDYEKLERYMRKAIELDPKFGKAYHTLSLISEVRGDRANQLKYLKMAADNAPENPAYIFYYSRAVCDDDLKRCRELTDEIVRRFPTHERGAQALYWLEDDVKGTAEKIAILERQQREYPAAKYNWTASGVTKLYALYGQTAPEKAIALAEEMGKIAKTDADRRAWEGRVTYQRNLLQAQTLVKEKKFTEARTLLDATTPPRYFDATSLHLLKAEAATAAREPAAAYETLLKLMAKEPKGKLRAALLAAGGKLGKDEAAINADLWRELDAVAKPANEFTLAHYGDEKKQSLSDYRGKVVLLNFWYPFCGPCRGENPTLQKVLRKFKSDQFVMLAINVHPEEDAFVLPYLKGNKFDFIPLRGSAEFAAKEYNAIGMPTNFLIDQQGRIIFKPGVVRGEDGEETLELQVKMLIERGRKTEKGQVTSR
jgi:thiol-disulfide isomerase/thioredoxin